ncbi:MAG: hypothetical protein GY858_05435 [Candidatus Omnitrophica bacterium]|nr:hypothetical protein [Candidatus Omnitrophota bacterium]
MKINHGYYFEPIESVQRSGYSAKYTKVIKLFTVVALYTSALLPLFSSWYEEVKTKSSLSQGQVSQLLFTVESSNELYTDLSRTYLYLRAKITKEDGSEIGENVKVGPVNNLLGSLFKSVDMYLNGVRVSEVSDVYSYVSVSELSLEHTYL